MNLRIPLSIVLVGTSCVMAEPIGDQPDTEAGDSASHDGAGSGDGHTGMSNVDEGAASEPTGNIDDGGDSASASGTATSGVSVTVTVGDDTDPSVGESGGAGLLEQCGVELPEVPECPANFSVSCSCDGCDLEWHDVDLPTMSMIGDACPCLCEIAGCGQSMSGDVGGEDDGCDTGIGETSTGDTDSASSSATATSSGTNAE